jgi:hypothetical protein
MTLEQNLAAQSHSNIMDSSSLYDSFIDAFISASNQLFNMTCPNSRPPKESRRPWWNADCSAAVYNARQAEIEWRCSPLATGKKVANLEKDGSRKEKKYLILEKTGMVIIYLKLEPHERPQNYLVLSKSHAGE